MSLKIASRNVNGIRAVVQKGFYSRVQQNDPDIICLQEVKAFESQLPPDFRYYMKDYHWVWHAGERPGYAGVATLYKKNLSLVSSTSTFASLQHFHQEGRVVETKFQNFTLLNIYFPNGGDRADGTEMLTYKLQFYKDFFSYITQLRTQGEHIVTCGDFNICHHPIDIARPKENANSIGFLPIERAEMDALVSAGYVDVFRYFYPDLADQYTWWSFRAGARPNNVGWRLDYFWVDQDIAAHIQKITHQTAVEGSDHCPVVVEIDV